MYTYAWFVSLYSRKQRNTVKLLLLFSRSVVSDSLRPPWTAARRASLSITNSRSLPRLMSVESVMPSNHSPVKKKKK